MTKFSKLLLTTLCLLGAVSTSAFGQQVTTEMISQLSGNLTIAFPGVPCDGQRDTITSTGEVYVSATVDSTQNTVDHVNLLSVKGTGI